MGGELARMLDWAPGFICVLTGPTLVVEFVNRTHRKLFNSANWIGKPAREAIPEVSAQGFHDLLDRVYRTGERYVGSDLAVRYRPAPDAPEVTLYHDFVYEPIRDDTGRVTGIFCEGLDVTQAHEARAAVQRHAGRQAFRLDLERTVASGTTVPATVAAAARLIAERWNATDLVLTEDTPDAGGVCRRTYRRETGGVDEEKRPDFALADGDRATLLSGGRVLRRIARKTKPDIVEAVVARVLSGRIVMTVEMTARPDVTFDEDDAALLEDVTRRLSEAVDRLRAEAERNRFFDASLDLLCVASMDDRRIRRASRSFRDTLGREPEDLVGTDWLDLVHPDDRKPASDMGGTLERGERLHGIEQRVRHRDGSYRWISWSTTPVPEDNLIFGIGRDVTERHEFDAQRDRFIAELNHRVKNTLAVVQAMASQTFRARASDPAQAIAKYQKRIAALAAAHDLLTDNNWGPVALGDLVASVLARDERAKARVASGGPAVRLSPRQAIAMSLALNELVANASAHGALRVPGGDVALSWSLDDDRAFTLAWRESGAPAPAADVPNGFGMQLLTSLGDEFDGRSDFDRGAAGFTFRLTGRAEA